jgi:plastocyanin
LARLNHRCGGAYHVKDVKPSKGAPVKRVTICTAAALAAAAAGGVATQAGAKPDSAATTLKLKAAASGALKFNKSTLRAEPGRVTIRLRNPSSADAPHAVEVEGKGVEKESATIDPGDRTSLSVRLKRGTYDFYCPVGNHRAEGMEGKLVVR